MRYDYLIVGAGLCGAVFAHEMKEAGRNCYCIDRRPHIGGNIYTEEFRGIQVHKYGAHIFHTSDKRIWEYVNQFADFNHYVNSPVAVCGDELYNLPFNMNTFSKMWGIRTPAEAKAIIEAQRKQAVLEMRRPECSEDTSGEASGKTSAENDMKPANLEEQALSLVGRDVYEKLIKGYTEKQWGRSCKDLPAFIIKRLPVRYTYDNNYFDDRYQGIPIGGYTKIIEKLLEGTPVRLDMPYRDFMARNEKSSEPDTFDRIFYTGMIDEYFDYCLGELQYRALRFEEEFQEECDNYQGNAVVNYTDREIPYTRVIEHKHFEFGAGKGTVITREYPAAWEKGQEPCYPVNDGKNMALYERYRGLAAAERNVIFGGRLGQYRYYDMDKVIAEALRMAEKELRCGQQ